MLLEVEGLDKIYTTGKISVTALRDVSVGIDEGEYVAIMGPSGSGKSTFMNILGCLDRPSRGKYILNGEDISIKSDDELADLRNHYIGFIFQSFNLLPKLSALENVALPLVYRGVPGKKRLLRAKQALESVGLSDRENHLPSELSGGQQQRVAIARVLAGDPPLILADEPTGNLDSRSGQEVMTIFRELNDRGITIVLVTHDDEIAGNCKRVVRFRDGLLQNDSRIVEAVEL